MPRLQLPNKKFNDIPLLVLTYIHLWNSRLLSYIYTLQGLDHAQVLHIVQQVIDQFGGDATEAQIEGLCHQLIASNTSVFHNGCALLGRR